MGSLNMDNLANSLPSPAIVKAEQDTMDKFKAAAQSLTLLYRSSQQTAKRHYNFGYSAALEDIRSIIQHGVSASPDTKDAFPGLISISLILDWIEARQESMQTNQGDEEDDEERSKSQPTTSQAVHSELSSRDVRERSKLKKVQETTACTIRTRAQQPTTSSSPISPSPSSSTILHQSLSQSAVPLRPQTRNRNRTQPNSTSVLNADNPHPSLSSISLSSYTLPPTRGAKRRHAAMLLDSFSPGPTSMISPSEYSLSTVSETSSLSMTTNASRETNNSPLGGLNSCVQKRRLRNSRNSNPDNSHAENMPNINEMNSKGGGGIDMLMDSEDEEGRERKRLVRR